MPNRVEVLFEGRDLSVLGTAQQINRGITASAGDVAKAWREVELAEDRVGIAAEGGMRKAKRAAKDYLDTVIDARLKVEELAKQQERLQTLPSFVGKSLPVDLSSRSFRGAPLQTGGTGINAGAITEADAFKRTEQQIAFQRKLRSVTQDGKTAEDIQKAAQGLSTVRSGLLGISGIPRGEALGAVLELGGAGGGIGLVVAAAVAGVALLTKTIIQLKEESAKLLKDAEQGAVKFTQLTNQGGQGNLFLSEANSKAEEIRKFLEDLDKGRALGVSPDALSLEDKIKKLTDGAARNENDLRAASFVLSEQQKQRELKEFNLDPRASGNRFADAQKRFEGLASDRISIQQINRELDGLRNQYISGAISLEDYNQSLDRFERGIRLSADVADQAKKSHEDFNKSVSTNRAVFEQIATLRNQLQSNPFVTLYDEAARRQRSFLDQFKDVIPQIKDQFVELNRQVLSLDIFKARLARQDRLNDLLNSQEQLRAGLGGQANRDQFKERDSQRDSLIREIEQKRGAGILGREEHNSLLARLNALGDTSPLDRLEREATERRIASDRAALEQAGNDPLKQSLALDRLLAHTSDISKLNEDQISLRADALQRRIEVENAAQEKKQAQEAEKLATERELIPALKEFTTALLKGLGFDVRITDSPSTNSQLSEQPSPFSGSFTSNL
jgi:hypothetical protein